MATLRFEDGAVQFRQRIAVSLLSHRPLLIRNIHNSDDNGGDGGLRIGLQQHEASFLKLIDQMTNGTKIEINNTGTQFRFIPGLLLGGDIDHECPIGDGDDGAVDNNDENAVGGGSRAVSWYLEGILPLAPFGKEPLNLKLSGITDGTCHVDPSCDYWKSTIFKMMEQFGISASPDEMDILSPANPSLRIHRRGAAPLGGGLVEFYCPIMTRSELRPIEWIEPGKFKRVRGTAISTKVVSTSQTARIAYAAKGVLHRLLPDVWIHTDAHTVKNQQCGPSPSLSVILTATTTTGVVMSAECCRIKKQELPEDMGQRAACMLLEEIRRGGCIDTSMQSLALLWMCLTSEDVSRIRMGTLTPYTIESLRLFKKAFGVEFKVQADEKSKTVLLSCLGTGYRNMARAST